MITQVGPIGIFVLCILHYVFHHIRCAVQSETVINHLHRGQSVIDHLMKSILTFVYSTSTVIGNYACFTNGQGKLVDLIKLNVAFISQIVKLISSLQKISGLRAVSSSRFLPCLLAVQINYEMNLSPITRSSDFVNVVVKPKNCVIVKFTNSFTSSSHIYMCPRHRNRQNHMWVCVGVLAREIH